VSVRQGEDGVIVLEGSCPVEDAEPLLQLLQGTPSATCDWTGCDQLHAAVVQILLMAAPVMTGPCRNPWIEQWIGPAIANLRPGANFTGQP
jgi:hypothetical protein